MQMFYSVTHFVPALQLTSLRLFKMEKRKTSTHIYAASERSQVGLPHQRRARIFNCDGHTTMLGGRAGDLINEYICRGSEVVQRIEEEVRKYGSILQASYDDTNLNFLWKTVTNLRWLSTLCDKVHNDDYRKMNVSRIIKFFASVPKSEKRTFIHGYMGRNDDW